MELDELLDTVEQLAPGCGLGPDDPLDALLPYHRMAIARWLSDLFDGPTDLTVVGSFPTLRAAHAWIVDGLRAGERMRTSPRSAGGQSTRVRLRPLLDQDLLPLYLASLAPELGARWRFRGRTVPADELVATLGDGVRAQYVVELRDEGRGVGLVSAYDHHQAGLHCKLALLRFGSHEPGDAGAVLEGLALFIGHLFETFPYRKLYVEVPSTNLDLVPPGIFTTEGVLKDYAFDGGHHIDVVVASLDRSHWQQLHEVIGW